MNVTINIVELASELADKEVSHYFKYSNIDVYEIDDNDEGTKYSEEAQAIFDIFYDKYYSMIDNLKIN